jgi:hypothetical protein
MFERHICKRKKLFEQFLIEAAASRRFALVNKPVAIGTKSAN